MYVDAIQNINQIDINDVRNNIIVCLGGRREIALDKCRGCPHNAVPRRASSSSLGLLRQGDVRDEERKLFDFEGGRCAVSAKPAARIEEFELFKIK
jgi:hypothetical protein